MVLSKWGCLNPCCSGRWSRTFKSMKQINFATVVLILVVVDDGLVLDKVQVKSTHY